MHVAVLGGGGVGVCTALELAGHGCRVDLFEQDARPLLRASRVNEGKIHQGFLYAKDGSERTARLMMRGGLAFASCLSRWVDLDAEPLPLSTPFIYAVHTDTMVRLEALANHFAHCARLYRELTAESGLRYLGRDEPAGFHRLERHEIERILNPAHFVGAFATTEYAIDPRPVADRLRAAVLAEPRITVRCESVVCRVERRERGGFIVHFHHDGPQQDGPYDQVVNALWESRLAVDRSIGLEPSQTWIYRHKFGNRVAVRLTPSDLPSVTMVLGPFGDIVNFGAAGFYLSWYPSGMVGTTRQLQPPAGWTELDADARAQVFDSSFETWTTFCPNLRNLRFTRDQVDPSSGVIFAWGDTDIDDPASRLHLRDEIGVRSVDGYHTVNTGKYTMVPYFALATAARVLGPSRVKRGLPEGWAD